MIEAWVKIKSWLTCIIGIWIVLCFCFLTFRYGEFIYSRQFPPYAAEKLGDIVLLKWIDTTLVSGLLALFAAGLGALALYQTSNTALKTQRELSQKQHSSAQCAALRKCMVHGSIMRDQIDRRQKPATDDAFQFMLAADGLSLIDADLNWLGVGLARYTQILNREETFDPIAYRLIIIKLNYFIELLRFVESQIESGVFKSTRQTNYMPANLHKLKSAGFTIPQMGEFEVLFNWNERWQHSKKDS